MSYNSGNACEAHSSRDSPETTEAPKDEITCDPAIGYKIINFLTVFQAVSQYVKCKECNGEITFKEAGTQGLGFKLVVVCDNCESKYINSCPVIFNTYEINKRFIFAMKLLDIKFHGAEIICILMDLSRSMFRSLYNSIKEEVYTAVDAVSEWSRKKHHDQHTYINENNETIRMAQNLCLKISCDKVYIRDMGTCMVTLIRNDGFKALLKVYEILGINVGPYLNNFCDTAEDDQINGINVACLSEIMLKGLCPERARKENNDANNE